MNFEEMGIAPDLIKALKDMDIIEPTGIQVKSIPAIREGKDLIGMSKTGSGKTAAFGIPLLEKIVPGQGIQMLIMAPIRELALQIAGELEKFAKYNPRAITVIFGGVGYEPQIQGMNKADIIVATPGRLLDHLQQKNVNLSTVKFVVLDEADKMVDMGFIEDVDKIVSQTSNERQVLLFGATISHEIQSLEKKYMHDPVTAKADKYVKDEYLEQYFYNIKRFEKFSLLVHLLRKEKTDRVIVFCSARSTVEVVTNNLRKQGFKAEMIHGKMMQNKRMKVIEEFHKNHNTILVASAVAARGLDIKDVSHVMNYDLSQDPQEYVHRVGRTARAGEKGKAITLLCDTDHDNFRSILSRTDMDIEELQPGRFPNLKFDAGRTTRQPGRFNRQNYGGGNRPQRRDNDRPPMSGRRDSGRSSGFGGQRMSRSDGRGGPSRRFDSGERRSEPPKGGFDFENQDDGKKISNWRTANAE
ncbi:DEAD/DEAH box helicase [Nanoarchaeota archaeon]